MSKNLVYHPESIRPGRHNGFLFNNPSPSYTREGSVRNEVYMALARNRRVSDAEREGCAEDLKEIFPGFLKRLTEEYDGEANYSYRGTSLKMQAAKDGLQIVTSTPHHHTHRLEIVEGLVRPVPTATIEVEGQGDIAISRHEAWPLAAGIAMVSLTSLSLEIVR